MPTERISMRRVRELIRLSEAGLSVRQLAGALRLSVGAVSKYGRALRAAGLTWAVAQTLDDGELERRLFGAPAAESGFAAPDCAWIHQELKRHRSVTLKLLWEEYREQHGAQAYRYSAFCTAYRGWQATLRRSMRQPGCEASNMSAVWASFAPSEVRAIRMKCRAASAPVMNHLRPSTT